MNWSSLIPLFAVAEELARTAPGIGSWLEGRDRKKYPFAFCYWEGREISSRIGLLAGSLESLARVRRYALLTSILTAKLANSALGREDTARETSFAEKAIPSMERLQTW